MRVTGYAYESDIHCLECSEERFGVEPLKLGYEDARAPRDMDGNVPGPIFDTDEDATDLEDGYCGSCMGERRMICIL